MADGTQYSLTEDEIRSASDALKAQEEERRSYRQQSWDMTQGSPEQAAEALALGGKFGVPRQAVEADPDYWRKRDADAQRRLMESVSPKTMAWLDNEENYSVAKDDIDIWGSIEGYFGDLARDPITTGAKTGSAIGGAAKAGWLSFQSTGADADREQLEKAARYYDELDAWKAREAERAAAGKGGFMGRLGFNTVDVGTLRLQLPGDTDPMPQPTARLIDEAFKQDREWWQTALGLPGKGYRENPREVVTAIKPLIQDKMDEAVRVSVAKNKAVDEAMPKTGDFLADSLLGGVRAITEMTPLIVSAIATRGKSVPTAVMGTQVYYNEYATGRERELDIDRATERAVLQAGVEAVSERISLGIIDDMLKDNGSLALRFGKGLILEQGQEQVATMGNRLVDWSYLEQGKTVDEFIAETPRSMLQTSITTLVASSGMQTTFLAADYATRALINDSLMMQPSKADKKIDDLLNAVSKSKLRTRTPEKAAELATKLAENTGAETVVIDLDGLAQSLEAAGLNVMDAMTEMGVPADAINETAIVMGQVEVPTARLMVSEGIQTHRDKVQPHLRLKGEDLTPAQKEAIGAEATSQAQKFSEAIREDVARDADFAGQMAEVEDQVTEQLRTAGFSGSSSVLRANAVLASRMAGYVAKRSGKDVRDVWSEIGPKIVGSFGEGLQTDVLRQAEEAGYQGADMGEAASWLRGVEKFGPEGMTTEARMARAREMGFDTDAPVYRGLTRPYDAEKAGRYQMFTSSAEDAGEYAGNGMVQGGTVVPVYLRRGQNLTVDGGGNNFNSIPVGQLPADVRRHLHPSTGSAARTDQIAEAAQKAGYDSVSIKNVFDNAQGEVPFKPRPAPKDDVDALLAELEAAGFDMSAKGSMQIGPEIPRNYDPVTVDIIFDPANIRSVHAAFDPDQSASADLLSQSIRKAAAMDMAEVKQWVIDNVTASESDFPNGDVLTVIKFPLTEDPDAPEVMLSIRLKEKANQQAGRADVNLFLDNQMADALDSVEDPVERGTLAKIMFAKTVMVMRQYAAEYDVKAFNFIAAESQAEGTNAKSREDLYRFMLSSLPLSGYTAYELDNQMSVVREEDGAKSADPLFPSKGFVLVRDGVNVEEYARSEIIRGSQRGGDAGEVVTVLTATRLGRKDTGDRGGRGRGGTGASDAGGAGQQGSAGDELNQLIGPKAKGADKAILNRAKEMAKERVKTGKGLFAKTKPKYTRQQIWDETAKLGQPWYQDKNGDWISEIEDGSIVVKDASGKMEEVIEMPSIYAEYPQLGKMRADARDKARVKRETGKDEPGGVGGWYQKSPFLFGAHVRIISRGEQAPYTATHEIQHAVDDIEGREMGRKKPYYMKDTERRAFNTMYRRLWTMEERIATPPWKTEDEAVRWWGGLRSMDAPEAQFDKDGTLDPGAKIERPASTERDTPAEMGNVPDEARNTDLAMPGEPVRKTYFDEQRQRERVSIGRGAAVLDSKLAGRTFLSFKDIATAMVNNARLRQLVDGEAAPQLTQEETPKFEAALAREIDLVAAAAKQAEQDFFEKKGEFFKVMVGSLLDFEADTILKYLDKLDLPLIRAATDIESIAQIIAANQFDGTSRGRFGGIEDRIDTRVMGSDRLEDAIRVFRGETVEPRKMRRGTNTATSAETKRVRDALEGHLLDLDKTVDEQTPEVAAQLRAMIAAEQAREDLQRYGYSQVEPGYFDGMTVNQVLRELAASRMDENAANYQAGKRNYGMQEVVETLRDAGIVGARYVPGGVNASDQDISDVKLDVLTSQEITRPDAKTRSFGNVILDKDRNVFRDGDKIGHLTERERDLVALFMANPNSILPPSAIVNILYPQGSAPDEKIIAVFIAKIRKKMGPNFPIKWTDDGYALTNFDIAEPGARPPKERVPQEDAPPQTQSIVIFDERAPVLLTDQSGNLMQERRGGYSPSTRQIVFTEARDVSTFMHETAHWFLDTLEKLAPTEAWAAADLAEIEAWWNGVRDTPAMAAVRARYSVVAGEGGWQVLYQGQPMERPFASEAEALARIEWRERQEAFAETFEQYLQTGKSPTPKLVDVFRAFRDWLVQLYKGMMPGERAALNPAIQAVFDRVLAVDTEVDAASAEAFRDADTMAKEMLEKGIITERQYRMVGERLNKAREEVKEEMIARALKEEMRTREDWWAKEKARVKGDLARAFDKSEVGRAFNWLAYGEWKGDVAEEQSDAASEAELFQSGAAPRTLFVAHNTSEEKLRKTLELGGFPMPSLAVARTDTGGFPGYGEITFLADPKLLDEPDVTAYDADIYSPRVPEQYPKVSPEKAGAFVKKAKALIPEGAMIPEYLGYDETDRELPRTLMNSELVQLAYLSEQGRAPKLKKLKVAKEVKAALKTEYESPERAALALAYYTRLDQELNAARAEKGIEPTNIWVEDDGTLSYRNQRNFDDLISEAKRSPFDQKAYKSELYNRTMGTLAAREKFAQYTANLAGEITESYRIFKGFTYSGNRKWAPFNLENVMAEMRKDLREGNHDAFGGTGSIRARVGSTPMKKMKDVQRNRDRIVSEEEMREIKDRQAERFMALADEIAKHYKFAATGIRYYDAAAEAIAGGPREWRESFGEDALPAIRAYVEELKALPTEYFEAKANRVMQVGDFAVAVVPRTVSADIKQALQTAGVQVRYYKKGDEADRLRAIEQQDDMLFQTRTFNPPGHGPVAPPPDVPPVRLDLRIVKDLYGEEVLRKLPAAVRRRSSTSSNVTDMLAMIETVRKTLAKKRKGPQTLTQFIMAKKRTKQDGTKEDIPWGIKGAADELKAMGLGKLINEKSGRTLDYVREAAEEAGFIRPKEADLNREAGDLDTTLNDLLEALGREAKGESVVRIGEEGDTKEADDARVWADWLSQNGVDIYEADKKKLRASVEAMLSQTDESLVTPDQAAELFGFPNGEELLKALAQVGSRDKFLDEQADRQMGAEFGDMMKDGTLIEEAREAARLSILGRQSEIELEALSRAVGQQASVNYARQMARDIIALRTVKEISAYERDLDNERRFSKQALSAVAKGDYAGALKAKQRQIIAAQMYREGKKAHERIEKAREHLQTFETSETKRKRLTMAGASYLDQMDDLLSRYRLRKEGPKAIRSAESLHEWATRELVGMDPLKHLTPFKPDTQQDTEQGEADPLAGLAEIGRDEQMETEEALAKSRTLERLAEESAGTSYQKLTYSEFMSVREQADMIYHLAMVKTKLIAGASKRDLREAIDEIVQSIMANKAEDARPDALESDLPSEVRRRQFRDYMDAHRTLLSLFRQMDGGKDGGPLQMLLAAPLSKAFGDRASVWREMEDGIAKLFEVYEGKDRRGLFSLKVHVPELDLTMTKQGVLAVALNMGTEKNRQRMMDSEGWSEADLYAIVDSLDRRDWQFVQSVWAYLETWFPRANEVHKRVHGLPMDKVEAIPVVTKYGAVDGGYWPIVFDPVRSSKSAQRQLEKEAGAQAGRVGARSRAGFTKARVAGKVAIPIRYSVLDVLVGHLGDVADSITLQEPLMDVGRIVVHPDFEAAIKQKYGSGIYRQILLAMREAKQGQEVARNEAEKLLVHLRNGATVVGLGWRFSTAALQVFGLSNSAARIGTYWLAKGVARTGATALSKQRASDFATTRSTMMANRKNSQQREIADLRNKFKGEATPTWVKESFFWMITATQFHIVDVPTWLGQYEKSIAAGETQEDAALQADLAVQEAQGTGEIYGLAGIQRGSPLLKLFTNFLSYMVTTFNLAAQKTANTNFKNPKQVAGWSMDMTALLVWPVLTKILLDAVLKGAGPDEDDDETWMGLYLKQQAAFLMSMNFIPAQITGMATGYTFDGPTGTSALKDIEATGIQIVEAANDPEQPLTDAYRPALRAVGAIFHIPTGQLDTSILGLRGLMEGESEDYSDLLFGPDQETRDALKR